MTTDSVAAEHVPEAEAQDAPDPVSARGSIPVWRAMPVAPVPPGAPLERQRVVIVGTGPVGLALAIDLATRGHPVVVLGQHAFISAGSKALCFSKRSLDILDRLGIGEDVARMGVQWNLGKVFWREDRDPVYQFDMLAVKGQKMPGFVNLQQYHLEDLLVARAAGIANIDLRWGHAVAGVTPRADGADGADAAGAVLDVRTPDGEYRIDADWLIACDGSRSAVRTMLDLDFEGRVFEDNFLIADIRMETDQPDERWFWFDPPFNPGRSVLMHKQPDGIWRIDFQLGWNIDRQACVQPENVAPMVRAMLGPDVAFEQEWYSVYTFQCRRMARFVHGGIVFAGDSAHLVSPFGARGCNGGLADADNLAWKLDLILNGEAPRTLIDSYDHEAIVAAEENIRASTRSTDFLTPKSATSTIFRDSVLALAGTMPFARRFVNSGRLSTPVAYPDSAINTPDRDDWGGAGLPPGSPPVDARIGGEWLLERLDGRFVLVTDGPAPADCPVPAIDIAALPDADAAVMRERYGLRPGAAYLIRPDQYVAARWRHPDVADIAAALHRAKGGPA